MLTNTIFFFFFYSICILLRYTKLYTAGKYFYYFKNEKNVFLRKIHKEGKRSSKTLTQFI